jgi:cytochrome c
MKLIKTLLLAGAGLMIAGQASADEALAKAKNCMSCHAVDKKVVGPSYKDVAKKYAGQADAAAKLEAKVKKGGSGVWGHGADAAEPGCFRRRHQETDRLGSRDPSKQRTHPLERPALRQARLAFCF